MYWTDILTNAIIARGRPSTTRNFPRLLVIFKKLAILIINVFYDQSREMLSDSKLYPDR